GIADQLHHDVGAPVVGEAPHAIDPAARGVVLAEVDGLVGPELPRQGEPLVHPVDDHDLPGAHLAGDRAGVDAEPAGPLDDDGLAGAKAGDVQRGVDLGEGAVDAGCHRVGDVVGDPEDGVAGPEIEVLAVAALEVGPDVAAHRPVRLPGGAG